MFELSDRLSIERNPGVWVGRMLELFRLQAEEDVNQYNKPRGLVEPKPLLEVFEPYLEDELHGGTEVLSMTLSEKQADSGVSALVPSFFS